MTEIAIMWSILSKMGSSEPKISPMLKGSNYHTVPLQFLGNCTPLGPIIHDKQFPAFINRSNPSAHSLQNNQKMDRPQEVNSSPQKAEIVKNNPVANIQACNSKKKKKRRRRKKKKKNQSQVCTDVVEKPFGGCHRQRQLSTTESEDSFVIFFDEALSGNDRISELSENETVTTEDFDSLDSVIPHKKVRFASELCEVHPMIMWSYAYQAARKGPWEEYARDRDRFNKRIVNTEADIGHVFDAEHRAKIYRERFA